MTIKQTFFSGERPRMATGLLKDYEAQIAQNCDLSSGDFRSLKAPSKSQSLVELGTLISLYHWKTDLGNHWIASTYDLDFVRSPIAGESRNRVYFTGMGELRALSTSILSTPFDFSTDFYKVGPSVPAAPPTIDAGYTTGNTYRAYVYTYVVLLGTDDAEEGPPCQAVASVVNYGSGPLVLSGFTEPPTQRSIGKIRVYRTNSDSAGVGEFQYVGEFATAGVDFSTYTFTDNVADADLGEVLTTEHYATPPAGLQGLVSMVDGSLAGFVGNRVYFSESFLPHAFPYSYPVDAEIVGLAVIGGSAVAVLTDEFPYIMTGQPDVMQTQKFAVRYPCVSKPGITSCELGVLYPSDEGIVLLTYDGPSLLSFEYFTITQYNDNYFPMTVKSIYFRGKHYSFHAGGAFVIDLRDKTLSRLSLGKQVSALHVSLVDNELYLVAEDVDATSVNGLFKFDGDTPDYLQYTFRSKNFILPSITSFSVARLLRESTTLAAVIAANVAAAAANAIIMTSGGSDGVINEPEVNSVEVNSDGLQQVYSLSMTASITFNLYADGALLFTTTVNDDEPFRLPADILYKRCYYEIIGYVPVEEVAIANSMRELDGA